MLEVQLVQFQIFLISKQLNAFFSSCKLFILTFNVIIICHIFFQQPRPQAWNSVLCQNNAKFNLVDQWHYDKKNAIYVLLLSSSILDILQMVVKEYISSLEAKLRVKVILLELATEETRKSFPNAMSIISHAKKKKKKVALCGLRSFSLSWMIIIILFWRDFRSSLLGSFIKVISVLKSLFILVHTIFIIFSREEKTWDVSSIYSILFFNSKTPKHYYKMTFNRGGWNDGHIDFYCIYSYYIYAY